MALPWFPWSLFLSHLISRWACSFLLEYFLPSLNFLAFKITQGGLFLGSLATEFPRDYKANRNDDLRRARNSTKSWIYFPLQQNLENIYFHMKLVLLLYFIFLRLEHDKYPSLYSAYTLKSHPFFSLIVVPCLYIPKHYLLGLCSVTHTNVFRAEHFILDDQLLAKTNPLFLCVTPAPLSHLGLMSLQSPSQSHSLPPIFLLFGSSEVQFAATVLYLHLNRNN